MGCGGVQQGELRRTWAGVAEGGAPPTFYKNATKRKAAKKN